ncbi:phosphodiester glycosidase family protein [Pelosinus sp. sgz500959]|uniref:phosphodiester glycosidase family protein n=1 Tax=Pelosinus sp. sgz500959 TaxID=3242472 RepID=UPI003670A4E8
MFQRCRRISVIMVLIILIAQVGWAAAAKSPQPILQKIRYSQTPQILRIVFDVTTLPNFTTNLTENPDQLIVNFDDAASQISVPDMIFNDPVVSSLQLSTVDPGKQRAIINLKKSVSYKVFTLANPNRVVIDINKGLDQKIEEPIVPGVKHISLIRDTAAGAISAHIVDFTLGGDYIIKPVLSNDAISGLERLQSMAERNKAIVAVNASYFGLNGEIIGLLKMDGEIVSTSDVVRTAFGVLSDGKVIMDSVDSSGSITLPDGRIVAITGVNHERGQDDLILYNNYYDSMTGTNQFGSDYIINNGKIIGIAHGNAAIPPGGVVLSAHGAMEKALLDLKVGDTVKITQTMGETWDKTKYVIGAGPRLVKNGSVFLTSKVEEFPSDITTGRAPRTAVGLTKDKHVILVTVDGRQQSSIGMTLLELALFMQEWGAVDAMNLDGGGSSEMVINGMVLNKPSDGRERLVGDALVIVPKDQ